MTKDLPRICEADFGGARGASATAMLTSWAARVAMAHHERQIVLQSTSDFFNLQAPKSRNATGSAIEEASKIEAQVSG